MTSNQQPVIAIDPPGHTIGFKLITWISLMGACASLIMIPAVTFVPAFDIRDINGELMVTLTTAILIIVCTIAMWNWKKWGVYGWIFLNGAIFPVLSFDSGNLGLKIIFSCVFWSAIFTWLLRPNWHFFK